MTVLLDTHVLIWAARDSSRLSVATRQLLDDEREDVLFSVASIWEIVIKSSLGRNDFRVDPARLRNAAISSGMGELPVRGHHVLDVAALPKIHADPFDRILLAQARTDELTLVTADEALLGYGPPTRRA